MKRYAILIALALTLVSAGRPLHPPLVQLILNDSGDVKAYAKKYGAWTLNPDDHMYLSDGENGSHHVAGVGDVSLAYLQGDPKAWIYVIDQTPRLLDDIVDEAHRVNVRSTSASDLYRITGGPLNGDFVHTSGYYTPKEHHFVIYTAAFSKKFYKESF